MKQIKKLTATFTSRRGLKVVVTRNVLRTPETHDSPAEFEWDGDTRIEENELPTRDGEKLASDLMEAFAERDYAYISTFWTIVWDTVEKEDNRGPAYD